MVTDYFLKEFGMDKCVIRLKDRVPMVVTEAFCSVLEVQCEGDLWDNS